MAEDITGLGKLAESKIVTEGYQDLLAVPLREGGKALTDLVKVFRLFTAPLQLLAIAQDRLAAFCESVRNSVPEERQIEVAPSIAIPILTGLRQTEDTNPLVDLYLNLLRKAIDRDHVGEAHPAFAKIIDQMSPDEAVFMHVLSEDSYRCMVRSANQDNSFPYERLRHPDNASIYSFHLEKLGLVHRPAGNSFIELTPFGELFNRACIPATFTAVVISEATT